MTEYIIVGKLIDDGIECMVYLAGKDKMRAEMMLDQVKNNPTERDLEFTKGFDIGTLRLKEVESEKCWWNDPFLAN